MISLKEIRLKRKSDESFHKSLDQLFQIVTLSKCLSPYFLVLPRGGLITPLLLDHNERASWYMYIPAIFCKYAGAQT